MDMTRPPVLVTTMQFLFEFITIAFLDWVLMLECICEVYLRYPQAYMSSYIIIDHVIVVVVVGTNMVVLFLTLLTMYLCFDSAGRTFAKLQHLHKIKQQGAVTSSSHADNGGGGREGQGETEEAAMISRLVHSFQRPSNLSFWHQRHTFVRPAM